MLSHSRTFQKQQDSAASPRSDRIWKPFWVLWMLSCWSCFSSLTGFNSPSLSFRTIILLWFFTPCCSRVWSKTHTHTYKRSHDLRTLTLSFNRSKSETSEFADMKTHLESRFSHSESVWWISDQTLLQSYKHTNTADLLCVLCVCVSLWVYLSISSWTRTSNLVSRWVLVFGSCCQIWIGYK